VKLTLVVVAKGDCHAEPFVSALSQSGLLTDAAVEVQVMQDSFGVLDVALPEAIGCSRLSGDLSIFQLWGQGTAASRARDVAILDIHCPPAPGLFAAVAAELKDDPEAFFGPVEPAYDASDRRMVGYLVEYVQFHRPIAAGMGEVAGNNLVMRRDLAGEAQTLKTAGFVKTQILPTLAQAPRLVPEAVVLHGKPYNRKGFSSRRYWHGRAFAAHRPGSPGAPPRLLALLFTPLLPVLRVMRIHRHAARVEACRIAFWRFLPDLILAETCWSFGELVGYLTGDAGPARNLD